MISKWDEKEFLLRNTLCNIVLHQDSLFLYFKWILFKSPMFRLCSIICPKLPLIVGELPSNSQSMDYNQL